ncbi:transcription termination/antitermination NusG family protein [Aeromonas jandaei]|uniref:transcription termination/antitermination NusG family protein n=1 Tax=Aeromonas jandaei TaxID=650 RepID=UPI003BA0F114
MEQWYLAIHKPGKGNAIKAQLFLSNIGVDVFIPQICRFHHRVDRPGQYRKIIEPLFPGYLFICFDYEKQHINKVESCPGVSRLVRFGGQLKPLNEAVVDEIVTLATTVSHDGIVKSVYESKQSKIKDGECHSNHVEEQRNRIKQIASDISGENRSILFYAFLDTINA